MPILNFQRRFVAPILAGTKVHTIRAVGRRLHRPGEMLYMQTGDRYHPERFNTAFCVDAPMMRMTDTTVMIGLPKPGLFRVPPLDLFAQADGFDCWETMRAWFMVCHEVHRKPLSAQLVKWAPAPWEAAFTPAAVEVDPYQTTEYAAFVDEMAKFCYCTHGPCDGVLAGGPCDGIVEDDQGDTGDRTGEDEGL